MRDFSRLGVKLVGLLVLYWSFSHLRAAVFELPPLFVHWPPPNNGTASANLRQHALASDIAGFIVAGFFAVIFLERTEWIVSKFKLPVDPVTPFTLAPEEALRVSLIVVGAIAVIYGFPGFFKGIVEAIAMWHDGAPIAETTLPGNRSLVYVARTLEWNALGEGVTSIAQFLLGCLVLAKSRNLAARAFARE